jgi:hypothetical protein
MRSRHERFETFRTPNYAFEPLLDYNPEWFQGRGFDPSAGDGRMIGEIIKRGNPGPHFVNDIRHEEFDGMSRLPGVAASVSDYLATAKPPSADFMITNPPFTKSVEFVSKARTHIGGPICILQSIAWQSTRKRSEWLRNAGLALVLNLTRRPKWQVDGGGKAPSNIWDFAWFVFLPGHSDLPQMDWR